MVNEPLLLNVRTNRLFWHAGAGIDSTETFDRHKQYIKLFGDEYVKSSKKIVKEVWEKCLSR